MGEERRSGFLSRRTVIHLSSEGFYTSEFLYHPEEEFWKSNKKPPPEKAGA
jgi:hypothetical protein